jgi:flavodoxin
MTRRNFNRKPWRAFVLLVFVMSWFYSPLYNQGLVSAETAQVTPAAKPEKPLIVYYTLTGTNKMIAEELQKRFSCDVGEIKTASKRSGIWGFVVSGYENFFNKDAELQPFTMDLNAYNPIIICTPLWLQKISSPARTLLKNPAFKGKDLYLFVSFNDHWGEDKEAELIKDLTAKGINLKGIYRVMIGGKTEDEIKKELIKQLEKKPILQKAATTS